MRLAVLFLANNQLIELYVCMHTYLYIILIFNWLNFKRIDIDYIKIAIFSLMVVLALVLFKKKINVVVSNDIGIYLD